MACYEGQRVVHLMPGVQGCAACVNVAERRCALCWPFPVRWSCWDASTCTATLPLRGYNEDIQYCPHQMLICDDGDMLICQSALVHHPSLQPKLCRDARLYA
jgi:hypothetical protein